MPNMTINGRAVTAGTTYDVVDPATGEVFATAPQASVAQLDAAVTAAQAAFPIWRDLTIALRREALVNCANRIRSHVDELATLLVREQGKPLAVAQGEVMGSARWFEYTAGLPLPGEVVEVDGIKVGEVRRKPYGVVGAIVPWNYPLISAAWKIAPALLTGNTLVLKPSPFTPLTTLRLGEILLDLLPAGVLNIVSATDDLAPVLTGHPGIRKLTFTGSTATGKKIFAAAASDFKGVTLELGGNDAAIVLEKADIADIAPKLFAAAFTNSGQVCSAIKRVYVHDTLHDELVAALADLAKAAVVGNGLDETVTIGPLTTKPQFDRVLELLMDAAKLGGRFAAGEPKAIDRPGYYIAPAIVTDLDDQARLVAEEQFGPALPILRFTEVDDAIERANATPYGLSASVWGTDVEAALDVAGRLDAGTVWVNQHMKPRPQLPTAGVKTSGVGAENGAWGLEGYLQIQTVAVA
ncbi:MAG: aldehyde dehydrogenase family protein [Asticcacaulis sp.]|uniref:aldehyde dehydrogenase family protein n=1 Tax=Asticcacaulis sp. TaxID=1872648 RepID=UPI0039E52F26